MLLVVWELLAQVIRQQLAVLLVLTEECILGIKDLVAELRDELFEETTAIDTLLDLAQLVKELDR